MCYLSSLYLRDLDEAQHTLKNVIKEARKAITEGRDAAAGITLLYSRGNDVANVCRCCRRLDGAAEYRH